MLQYAIYMVGVLRMVPLAVLLPGMDGQWLSRLIHTLTA
jgi:hypothetical protein